MLLQCCFDSWALGHAVRATVILPSDVGAGMRKTHQCEGRFPVLYLLHGGGGDDSSWLRFTSIERYASERRIAVVLPSCPDLCYRLAEISFPGMAWEEDKTEDFETFIARELPDWAGANFPISTERKDSFIAGLSLGAYGAAYHGFTHPEHYTAVGLFSPYLLSRRAFDPAFRSSRSPEALMDELIPDLVLPVRAIAAQGGAFPKVFMMNGTKDVRELAPLYAQLLRQSGAEVTADFTSYDYGHEWAMWDLSVKAFLDWLPRSDAFAPAE